MEADPVPSDDDALSPSVITAHVWSVYDGGGLLTTCAWCGRILVEGRWIRVPAGVLSIIDEATTLSHSICANCLDALAATRPPADAEAEADAEARIRRGNREADG